MGANHITSRKMHLITKIATVSGRSLSNQVRHSSYAVSTIKAASLNEMPQPSGSWQQFNEARQAVQHSSCWWIRIFCIHLGCWYCQWILQLGNRPLNEKLGIALYKEDLLL